jgi:hypoxanthine phosphoribosyltransferase
MRCFTNIEKQIFAFISELVKQEQIDLIVCSERKATAILRALITEMSSPFVWDWVKTVSTTALSQFDWSTFDGKKVLLFDELVHHGNTLKKYEDLLRKCAPSHIGIVTAGFAVWEQCTYKPQFSFYNSVDSETYENIREDIVFMLQKYGSLLLDTEHIELSVRIQCGVGEFYDELAKATESHRAFSFISGAGRTNLTLEHPDIIFDDIINRYLTPGSNLDGIVCKIRVLERTHEVFSILPIIYPNVRGLAPVAWWEKLPSFCNQYSYNEKPNKEVFYIVGLLCSVELLRGVVAALSDFIHKGKIVLEVPKDNFAHLRAMFPRIDTEKLRDYVFGIVADSKKLRTKRNHVKIENVPNDRLLALSGRVMCRLVEEHDECLSGSLPKGESWNELIQIIQQENHNLGLRKEALSIVVDRLIDSGLIVTDVERVISSSGEPYFVRTFTPEGEIVSSKIRQQMMVRMPECMLAI